MAKAKLPETTYPALQKFVMKGVTTKDAARNALDDLRELIGDLECQADAMDDALCTWEDGDDAEARAEGKDELEAVVNEIDGPLSNAGFCAGLSPYDPPDV